MWLVHLILGLEQKGRENVEYYTDLKYEILKCRKGKVKKVLIIPIIIGALGLVTINVKSNLA